MTAGMGPRQTIDKDLPGIGAASVAGAFRITGLDASSGLGGSA